MNKKNRFGDSKEQQIKELRLIEGIYTTFNLFDSSPKTSQEVFRGCDSMEDLENRLNSSFEDTSDPVELRKIGAAYNHLKIQKLFEKEKDDSAKKILAYMSKAEIPLTALDFALKKLRTNFTDLCVESRQLLTPSELDKLIFERFCPDSIDLCVDFLDKEGICIISSPDISRYDMSLSYIKLDGKMVKDDLRGSQYTSIDFKGDTTRFVYEGARADINPLVSEMFRDLRVENYGILDSTTKNVVDYVLLRNKINLIGRAVSAVTPIRFQPKSYLYRDFK